MAPMRVPYAPILVEGFILVATLASMEHTMCDIFLVPLINLKSINYTSKQ